MQELRQVQGRALEYGRVGIVLLQARYVRSALRTNRERGHPMTPTELDLGVVVAISQRQCRTCRVVKTLADFYTDRCYSDGYKTECRKCQNSRSTLYKRTQSVRLNAKRNEHRSIDRNHQRSLEELGRMQRNAKHKGHHPKASK